MCMRTAGLFVCTLVSSLVGCMVGDGTEPIDEDLEVYSKKAAVDVTFVQHNIEKKAEVLAIAVNHAVNQDALGMTLEEVCPGDVAALRTAHPSWTIVDVQQKHLPVEGCDNPAASGGHDFGHVLAVYFHSDGAPDPHPDLGAPAAAPGEMACVKFDHKGVTVHLCAAHLISTKFGDTDGETIRENQTQKIRQITTPWINNGHFVVVGGDFNGKPETHALDYLYDKGYFGGAALGQFTEYNRSGGSRQGGTTAATSDDNDAGMVFKKKIDYLFFSSNRADMNGPNIQNQPDASDHNMITSTVIDEAELTHGGRGDEAALRRPRSQDSQPDADDERAEPHQGDLAR